MHGDSREAIWALALEVAPAALFGAAVAFCASVLVTAPPPASWPIAAGALAFVAGWRGLHRLAVATARFPLPRLNESLLEPEFEAPNVDAPVGPQVQSDADISQAAVPDELLLDDTLSDVAADSRVVCLFQPRSLPTAGQLQARIQHHLSSTTRPAPDATEALHEALAALRRSLR